MRIAFDDGTLLLHDAPDDVPYAEWDDRVDKYRTQAYRYRSLLDWIGTWNDRIEQRPLTQGFDQSIEDAARGVLGGGSHDVTTITVTTYDSAYRYINEYGDQFGLLVVDEEHHLPAPTYQQIPEMTIAPYRLGLTATYERPDGRADSGQ